jgi:hypothetical protein
MCWLKNTHVFEIGSDLSPALTHCPHSKYRFIFSDVVMDSPFISWLNIFCIMLTWDTARLIKAQVMELHAYHHNQWPSIKQKAEDSPKYAKLLP